MNLLNKREHLVILAFDCSVQSKINSEYIDKVMAHIGAKDVLITTYNGRPYCDAGAKTHLRFHDITDNLDDHMDRLSMWLHVHENKTDSYYERMTFVNVTSVNPLDYNFKKALRRTDEIGVIEDSSRNAKEMRFVLKDLLVSNSVNMKIALSLPKLGMDRAIQERHFYKRMSDDFTFPMSMVRVGLHMVILNE